MESQRYAQNMEQSSRPLDGHVRRAAELIQQKCQQLIPGSYCFKMPVNKL